MITPLEIIEEVLERKLSVVSEEIRSKVAKEILMELPDEIHSPDERIYTRHPLYLSTLSNSMSPFQKVNVVIENCDQEGHEKLVFSGTVHELDQNHKELLAFKINMSLFSGKIYLTADGAQMENPEQYPGILIDLNEIFEQSVEDSIEYMPLAEWAKREGISAATARQKAGRGTLETVRKVGRDWVIASYVRNGK